MYIKTIYKTYTYIETYRIDRIVVKPNRLAAYFANCSNRLVIYRFLPVR